MPTTVISSRNSIAIIQYPSLLPGNVLYIVYEYTCAFFSMQQTIFFFKIMFTHTCLFEDFYVEYGLYVLLNLLNLLVDVQF